MQIPKLVLCGSIAIDRIMSFDGLFREKIQPDKIDVLSVSILIDDLQIANGGNAGNMAMAATQLDLAPLVVGSAGPDAQSYLDELEAAGVDISQVHRSNLPTAMFSVVTDTDHNQFGGFYPGAMADSESLTLKNFSGQDVLVCISAHDPKGMRRQVAECRQQGLRLVYDPGQQTNNARGEDLLAGCEAAEIIIVNEYELGMLIKKTGLSEKVLKACAEIFVTTHGKNGSTIEGTAVKKTIAIPAVTPAKTADPTGAGDCYRVGFFYGLLNHWPVEHCGQLASTVASFNVESSRPVPELSTQAIETRYKQAFKQGINLS